MSMLISTALIMTLLTGQRQSSSPEVKPIQEFDCRWPGLTVLAFESDGKHLIGLDAATIHRLDLAEGKSIPVPKKLRGEKVWSGVRVENSRWLFALDRLKGEVDIDQKHTRFVLYDFETDAVVSDWTGHTDRASELAYFSKAKQFVTAGDSFEDHTVCFWEAKNSKLSISLDLVAELDLKPRRKTSWVEMRRMAANTDGTLLAFGFRSGAIHLYDINKKSWHQVQGEFQTDEDYKGVLQSLTFAGSDSIVVKWSKHFSEVDLVEGLNRKTGKATFKIESEKQLSEPAISPNGSLLAVGEESGRVQIVDTKTGKQLRTFNAHEEALRRIAFSSDSKRIVTTSVSGQIKIWKTEDILPVAK